MDSPRHDSDVTTSDEDDGFTTINTGMERVILADLGIDEEDLVVESDVIDDDEDEVINEKKNDVTSAGSSGQDKHVEVD